MKTPLYSVLYGSKLYGTSTPTSDRDVKHIVLPDINDLLLGRKLVSKVKKTNNQKNVRNSQEDVDEEEIPLQIFAKHFIEGQTYAIELAFSTDGNHAEQQIYDPRGEVSLFKSGHGKLATTKPMVSIHGDFPDLKFTPYFVQFVQELRTKFLTSNIKAMMGYVVNQASLYSFKGERLNVAHEFRAFLESYQYTNKKDGNDILSEFATEIKFKEQVEALHIKYPKYFKITEYDIGTGVFKPCFVLLEKTFPFTNTLGQSIKVVDTIIKKYGSRADQASESNVDWKATMHAIRIVDEGIELLTTKNITLPFKQSYVDRLLSIRRGEVSLDLIKEELSTKLDLLKDLEKTTDLPECNQEFIKEFEVWMVMWLQKFYKL